MKTDSGVIAAEAANFGRIATELTTIIKSVEHTGQELQASWKGQAGTAAQGALTRFNEAGEAQIKTLNDISETLGKAGHTYSAADEEHASSLGSQMNI